MYTKYICTLSYAKKVSITSLKMCGEQSSKSKLSEPWCWMEVSAHRHAPVVSTILQKPERWMRQLGPTMLVIVFNNLNVYYLTEETQVISVQQRRNLTSLALPYHFRFKIIHILCCCYFVSQSTFSIIFRSMSSTLCQL